jgi:hypothetical protein
MTKMEEEKEAEEAKVEVEIINKCLYLLLEKGLQITFL